MTLTSGDDPVTSGFPYPITEVDGHVPADLSDFLGETRFTLQQDALSLHVAGIGVQQSAKIRFHQKDLGPLGKDVRVWTITDNGYDGFVAEHAAAF